MFLNSLSLFQAEIIDDPQKIELDNEKNSSDHQNNATLEES